MDDLDGRKKIAKTSEFYCFKLPSEKLGDDFDLLAADVVTLDNVGIQFTNEIGPSL